MKFSKIFFTLFIISSLFSLMKIYAQTTAAPPFALRTDLIPPSPNAASLGKYGIFPVSLQTGIPNISIPLTQAIGQQLKVPVTLNYNNNGFKPSEEASWVGLGFSLDAGGVITRIVKDKVDELTANSGMYVNDNWRFTTLDSITNNYLDQAMYFGVNDTQPDVYAYNFSGYSGKFIIYKGKFYQYPYQQLTIGGDPSSGFTIITPDGNQYNFSLPEMTLALTNHIQDPNNSYYHLPSQYPTSWYLQSIVSPDHKDNINFTYSTPDIIVQNGPGTQNLKVQVLGTPIYTPNPISFPFPVQISTPRLTKITTSKMYINFNSSTTTRQDVATSYALANIEIYSYQGQLLNRFTFNTGYFPGGNNLVDNLRLQLTGLDEGISAQNIKKTRFFYNTNNFAPSKKLPGVDHWGYSNGGDIAQTGNLLPNTIYPHSGINKNPDFSYAQNNILTKIIYPSGGSTLFTWEPNLTNNGLNYVMLNETNSDFINRLDTTSTNLLTHTTSFTINYAQMVHVITSRTPKLPVTTGINDPNGPNAPTKDTAPEVVLTLGTQNYSFSILTNHDNAQKVDSVFLQPGTYSMLVQCDAKENFVTGTVTYLQKTNRVIEGVAGPGIRIKQITDYTDPESLKVTSVKQYIYKDSIGESTGFLLNKPNYGGKGYTEIDYTKQPFPLISNFSTYTSTNGSGFVISQDMYYKKVYERDISPKDTLLSISTFNLFNPFVQNGTTVFLTSKTDYRQSGNNYIKVKRQNYNYTIVTDSSFFAVVPYLSIKQIPDTTLAGGVPPDKLRTYGYDPYTIEPSWLKLNSTQNINYYNASDSVVTSTTYLYDGIPRNTIMVTTTDSKGRSTVEKNKYRENYAVPVYTPGVDAVVEKQEWLKRGSADSVLMSGEITQYDPAFYKPKTLYGFENVTQVSSLNQETKNSSGQYNSLLSDTRYKPRLANTFDPSTGNLTAQDLTYFSSGTTHEVGYLWGYHNNYPIAQVKNANPAAVAYTSFEDDDNSFIYTAANVVTSDARTGVKCYSGTISKSGLPAGNYSVSLWGKGTGTITIGGVAKTMTGNWAWYEWQLTNVSSVSINSNGNLVDEVRLLPANALMATYTYLPGAGVTSITDTKGITQFYDYDEMERLLDIKDKDGNIIKRFDYNYAVQGPNWTDTGIKQCVQSNGANTGEEQMQQVDTNPLSSTYNQSQWRSLGNTGNCPVPVATYILMTVAGASTATVNGNTHTFNTYSFKSYSDANCTIPLTLSSALTVNYLITLTETFNDGSANSVNTTAGTVTIAAGANHVTSPSIDISGCNGSGTKGNCVTSTVTLQPGSGYTPELPQN